MSEYFFFWKHRLSQWHIINFRENDSKYCCCEQYMMRQKALLFNDNDAAYKIMLSKNPADHQKIGRAIKNFNQKIWDSKKYNIVLKGNRLRFSQSPECRELLLETGDKLLVEASPYDRIWGIGMAESDPNILDTSKWGQNLLGKILTQVREEIKNILS